MRNTSGRCDYWRNKDISRLQDGERRNQSRKQGDEEDEESSGGEFHHHREWVGADGVGENIGVFCWS